MDGHYWSIERCAWVRCPPKPDALVTPWSDQRLPVPATHAVASARDVLRMPARPAAQVPEPREAPAQDPVRT